MTKSTLTFLFSLIWTLTYIFLYVIWIVSSCTLSVGILQKKFDIQKCGIFLQICIFFAFFVIFRQKTKSIFIWRKIMMQSFKNYKNIIYDINSSYENELCWFFLFIRVYSHFHFFVLFLEHFHDFKGTPLLRAITSDFQHWPIIFFLEMCKVMIEESNAC